MKLLSGFQSISFNLKKLKFKAITNNIFILIIPLCV